MTDKCDSKGRRLVQFYAGGSVKKRARASKHKPEKLAKGGQPGALGGMPGPALPTPSAPLSNPMDGRMTTGVIGRSMRTRRGGLPPVGGMPRPPR